MPILRSDTVGALLARLYLSPDERFTLTRLADDLGVSLPTVAREVNRMLESGLLMEERIGRARRVWVNEQNPLSGPIASLVIQAYGPKPVLEDLLRGVAGVEAAFIYGSWAARYEGVAGREPNDIDVLVIGTADADGLFEIADSARPVLHRDVSIRVIGQAAWTDPTSTDPFLEHVRSRPMVDLDLGSEKS